MLNHTTETNLTAKTNLARFLFDGDLFYWHVYLIRGTREVACCAMPRRWCARHLCNRGSIIVGQGLVQLNRSLCQEGRLLIHGSTQASVVAPFCNTRQKLLCSRRRVSIIIIPGPFPERNLICEDCVRLFFEQRFSPPLANRRVKPFRYQIKRRMIFCFSSSR